MLSVMMVMLLLGSGAALADVFTGTDGPDGNDNVSDGPPFDTGTDIAFGGAGDDLMGAYNDPPLTDTIYCGTGDDLVYTDGADILVDCEASILGPDGPLVARHLMHL